MPEAPDEGTSWFESLFMCGGGGETSSAPRPSADKATSDGTDSGSKSVYDLAADGGMAALQKARAA